MKVIVDTSVWSLALRRIEQSAPSSAVVQELQHLITDRRVQMMGCIRQELLSGIRSEAQFKKLEKHLKSFPDIPIRTEDYVIAAKFYNLCRSQGVQGSNTDFLICTIAVENKLSIFTTDQDFKQFFKHIPITLHRPELCGL